ncbi:MAG: WD40 repeat domain-containing protein [Anaerolineales bacterium]|nr:WD40 repeat domain-containing protein [Anaerolineales bacterium]
MKIKIFSLLLLAILITACTAESQPAQDTPEIATPTETQPPPTATRTQTPITADMLEEDVIEDLRQDKDDRTPTASPPSQLSPTPSRPYLACPEVSSQGELAGWYDDHLWVEDGSGSGEFIPIATDADCPLAWSPDGNKLLYSVTIYSSDTENREFWIWQRDTQTARPLKEIVPDLPLPSPPAEYYEGRPIYRGDLAWSPDSRKILFFDTFEIEDTIFAFVIADLEKGKAIWTAADDKTFTHGWLGSEYIYGRASCGSPCEVFTVFHYVDMEMIRTFHYGTYGVLSVSEDGSLAVNIGRWETNAIELLHVSTGESETIGEGGVVMNWGGYFPKISPDNQLIAYPHDAEACINTTVVNLAGQKVADFSCAAPVLWVSNLGVIAIADNGPTTLTYYPLDGSEPQVITPEGFFVDFYAYFYTDTIYGTWSPDGRYFLFEAHDIVDEGEQETLALFIWDAHTLKTFRIDSELGGYSMYPEWMPDSQSFYYETEDLWRYYVATEERVKLVPVFKTERGEVVTATPTSTKVPTSKPESSIDFCGPQVSNTGLLAFVQDDVLKVEAEAGSGKFFPVASNALCNFGWSPDGNKLLYSISLNPGDYDSLEYWIWDKGDQTVTPLYDIISGFPTPIRKVYLDYDFQWSPDSKKIIFIDLVPTTSEDGYDDNSISILDLEKGTLSSFTEVYRCADFGWINSDYFYVMSSCGSPCVLLGYYQYPRMRGNAAFSSTLIRNFKFSPDGTFIINLGRDYYTEPIMAVEYLDVYTNQVREIWQFPQNASLPPIIAPPIIASDNERIAFVMIVDDEEKLYVIDRMGNDIAQLDANGYLITWEPDGGILINRYKDEALEIIYWPVSDSTIKVVLSGESFDDFADKFAWSRNGHYLLLNLSGSLYLWDAQSEEEAQLISTDVNGDFAWMPDSGSFYYATDGILWRYFVESGERIQIAP